MSDEKDIKIDESYKSIFNIDSITKGKGDGIQLSSPDGEIVQPEKKKRGRKKKETTNNDDGTETVVVNQISSRELSMAQTNVPYSSTYDETNNMIKTAITEIDMYSDSVREELMHIKGSKTIKNKYNYIVDLTSAGSNLLSTKISAIKELNKTITDSHNLELKRQKEMNAAGVGQETDDQYMMNLYSAMMQMGVGAMPNNAFSINQMDFQNPGNGETQMYGVGDNSINRQLTPEQFAMRAEVLDKDIKVCVIYNSTTGEKWFEGRNLRTGESVPSLPIPDSSFLQDVQVYPNEGLARNVNLDQTYPLIVVSDGNINLY